MDAHSERFATLRLESAPRFETDHITAHNTLGVMARFIGDMLVICGAKQTFHRTYLPRHREWRAK